MRRVGLPLAMPDGVAYTAANLLRLPGQHARAIINEAEKDWHNQSGLWRACELLYLARGIDVVPHLEGGDGVDCSVSCSEVDGNVVSWSAYVDNEGAIYFQTDADMTRVLADALNEDDTARRALNEMCPDRSAA